MIAVRQIVAWGPKLYALAEDGTIWAREEDPDSTPEWYRIPGPPAEHNAKKLSESPPRDTDPHYGGPRSS